MTDVSSLSDAELLSHLALPSLIKRESGGRAGIQGPQTKWGRAQGLTQMLPDTARATAQKLGMPWRPDLMTSDTQEGADYQTRLGQAYLQEGIEKTGSLDGGARYYHGGPDKRQWGPKTDAYAKAVLSGAGAAPQGPDLSSMSDAQLLAALGANAPAKPPQRGRQPVPQVQPKPSAPQVSMAEMKALTRPQADGVSKGSFWGDMVDTVVDSGRQLGHDVMSDYRRTTARLKGPLPTIPQAVGGFVGDLGQKAKIVGDAVGVPISLLNAPLQAAVVKPASRLIAQSGAQAYDRPTMDWRTGKAQAGAKLTPGQTELAAQEGINTALSAARPATPVRPTALAPKPKPMTLDEVKTAKSTAYKAVDQSGFRFDPVSSKTMADDAASLVMDAGGKELYPKSYAMADRIQKVVGRGDLNLTKLDKLRSQIGEVVQKDEPYMAQKLRGVVDTYIDSTNAPVIKDARALHARQMKMEAVINASESADLRASSTYAGGNKNNATRQNLRPLIDPKSPQRIRNFTPDETRAANRAVRGSGGQNAVRLAGKMLDPRGLIGGIMQTTMGLGSHGLSTASIPVGMAASEAANAMTASNVQKLIDLISMGGVQAQKAAPVYPTLALAGRAPISPLSFQGAVGVTEASQPLLRKPDARLKKRTKRAKQGQR